jgi:hypothetical protein
MLTRRPPPEPPLPNLLGFTADEDKEFQASLARDRAEITLWTKSRLFRISVLSLAPTIGRGD